MPKYFDIHSHLNFPDYEKDFPEVIGRLRETGTHTICVGTDLKSSEKAAKLAEIYPEIYACIGMHPVDDPTMKFISKDFEKLVSHSKVVAIGECGLDFFHAKKEEDKERQENDFREHIEFALDHDKPLMIHSRSAYLELLDILEPLAKEHGEKLRGNVHFFAGDVEIAKRFFNIGFTISFTGVITFARNYDEVIKYAPLDMLMSETDSPYVSPVPYRGKRNEPSYVSEVVKKIAEIREGGYDKVSETLLKTTKRVFGVNLA
ncbi:MAG: TatD family hydrolase [bacterium]|nr:TatD family hydrolase [bacterium]